MTDYVQKAQDALDDVGFGAYVASVEGLAPACCPYCQVGASTPCVLHLGTRHALDGWMPND
jgi:hypothetical protein